MSQGRKLYILCGGQSRRMGRDKALIEISGKSLLEQQIKKGVKQFEEVVLLCGSNRYPAENRQLPDRFKNAGPLAGLLEALKDGAANSLNEIAIIPVDLPCLSESTLKRLSNIKLSKTDNAVLLTSGEDLQPLAGVYCTDLADKLGHFLETGNRMVFGFANGLQYSAIEVDHAELKNVNRPGDFQG